VYITFIINDYNHNVYFVAVVVVVTNCFHIIYYVDYSYSYNNCPFAENANAIVLLMIYYVRLFVIGPTIPYVLLLRQPGVTGVLFYRICFHYIHYIIK